MPKDQVDDGYPEDLADVLEEPADVIARVRLGDRGDGIIRHRRFVTSAQGHPRPHLTVAVAMF